MERDKGKVQQTQDTADAGTQSKNQTAGGTQQARQHLTVKVQNISISFSCMVPLL